MSSRGERRRQSRDPPPIIGRTEIIAAGVVFAAAALTLGIVFLVSSGGDNDDAAAEPTPVAGTPTAAAFVPEDDTGRAILELGRRSVEALPSGQWPQLYDSFTQEFRDRCPREEFEAAGEADAAAQGDRLSELRFVKLINVQINVSSATAVIIGAIGADEYAIGTSYALENGEWKIAPPPEASGCNGFTRLG
ncbi:MAG TPA: hypothetical protein VMR52_07715 [Dehalococcoidia bacterium]|nr:hypothetical protein [Dehalococcoidia bacterium]